VEDSGYCYEMLSRVFEWEREEFDGAFEKLARPSQIKWHPEPAEAAQWYQA
jgi:hypothetical protein